MRLETDRAIIENVSADQLRAELAGLEPNTNMRAILSRSDQVYLQTAVFANGFVIEKREGSEELHFHAVPPHPPLAPLSEPPRRHWLARLFAASPFPTSAQAFTRDAMERAFLAYRDGAEPDPPLDWRPGHCDS